MNANPLVSVVMPVYNCEKYIQESVDSILGQTYKNFELLIINNASTDKTIELLQQYDDERIKILNNEKNMGLLYSLQRGVKEAKGELIARLDGDDICMNTRFEKQIKYLQEHPDVWLCGTKVKTLSGNKFRSLGFQELCDSRYISFVLPFFNCVAHSSFMFRKKELEKVGIRYRSSNYCQDYFMLFDVALKAKIGRVNEYLVMYRIHQGQVTAALGLKNRNNATNRARKEYIAKLPFTNKEKQLFYAAVNGELATVSQLLQAAKVTKKYANLCQFHVENPSDREVFDSIMEHYFLIQHKSISTLIAFLLCKDTRKYWLITDNGKKFVEDCIIGNWKNR